MSSSSKSPTPSPKSSPKIKSLQLSSSPHSSSSESSTTVKISSPLNPLVSSKRSTPLSSSPDTGGMEYRLRVDSTGSTARSPSPSWIDAPPRIVTADSLRSRSLSPHRGRAVSPSRGSGSRTPDPGDSWWGGRELPARPWHEPPKRKKTIPPEQSERWAITRKVCGPFCDDICRWFTRVSGFHLLRSQYSVQRVTWPTSFCKPVSISSVSFQYQGWSPLRANSSRYGIPYNKSM